MHRTPALAGFVCAAVLSPAGARQQAASAAGCLLCSKSGSTSNSIPISITRRGTPPCGLHLRSHAFAQQRNSPHSLPVALVQQVCSCICRSFLPSAAPPDARALPAVRIRAQLHHNRCGLHSQSDEAQHLPCTALQPWRASFVQQVLSPVGARQQAASAAGCLLCSNSESTSSYIPISITKRCTPPCGLHLRNMPHRQTPKHSQQSAFAPGCSIRIGLHSQSNEAQHLPCTALQPWRASFVQHVLSPAGARQQAASAAGCLLCSKSAAAFAALFCQVPHRQTPEHSRQSASAPS